MDDILSILTSATALIVAGGATLGGAILRTHIAHMAAMRGYNDDTKRRLDAQQARLEKLEREAVFQRDRGVEFEKRIVAGKDLPVTATAHARGEAERCPFCLQSICGEGELVRCLACNTEHHQECHRDHGRCAVFGCGGRASVSGTRSEIATLA